MRQTTVGHHGHVRVSGSNQAYLCKKPVYRHANTVQRGLGYSVNFSRSNGLFSQTLRDQGLLLARSVKLETPKPAPKYTVNTRHSVVTSPNVEKKQHSLKMDHVNEAQPSLVIHSKHEKFQQHLRSKEAESCSIQKITRRDPWVMRSQASLVTRKGRQTTFVRGTSSKAETKPRGSMWTSRASRNATKQITSSRIPTPELSQLPPSAQVSSSTKSSGTWMTTISTSPKTAAYSCKKVKTQGGSTNKQLAEAKQAYKKSKCRKAREHKRLRRKKQNKTMLVPPRKERKSSQVKSSNSSSGLTTGNKNQSFQGTDAQQDVYQQRDKDFESNDSELSDQDDNHGGDKTLTLDPDVEPEPEPDTCSQDIACTSPFFQSVGPDDKSDMESKINEDSIFSLDLTSSKGSTSPLLSKSFDSSNSESTISDNSSEHSEAAHFGELNDDGSKSDGCGTDDDSNGLMSQTKDNNMDKLPIWMKKALPKGQVPSRSQVISISQNIKRAAAIAKLPPKVSTSPTKGKKCEMKLPIRNSKITVTLPRKIKQLTSANKKAKKKQKRPKTSPCAEDSSPKKNASTGIHSIPPPPTTAGRKTIDTGLNTLRDAGFTIVKRKPCRTRKEANTKSPTTKPSVSEPSQGDTEERAPRRVSSQIDTGLQELKKKGWTVLKIKAPSSAANTKQLSKPKITAEEMEKKSAKFAAEAAKRVQQHRIAEAKKKNMERPQTKALRTRSEQRTLAEKNKLANRARIYAMNFLMKAYRNAQIEAFKASEGKDTSELDADAIESPMNTTYEAANEPRVDDESEAILEESNDAQNESLLKCLAV